MAERTAIGSFGDDWRKYLAAGLALYTIVNVAKKQNPGLRDLFQLAAAVLFFAK